MKSKIATLLILLRTTANTVAQTSDSNPLTFTYHPDDKRILENRGNEVRARTEQKTHRVTVSGGLLYPDVYRIDHLDYKWNTKRTNDSASDSYSYEVQIRSVYFNVNYPPEEAREKPNATLIITSYVGVKENESNSEFQRYQDSLSQIINTGSSTKTTDAVCNKWCTVIKKVNTYRVYSENLESTADSLGNRPGTKYILFPENSPLKQVYPHISLQQFQSFQELMDNTNVKIMNTTFFQDHPTTERTTVDEGQGIQHISYQ